MTAAARKARGPGAAGWPLWAAAAGVATLGGAVPIGAAAAPSGVEGEVMRVGGEDRFGHVVDGDRVAVGANHRVGADVGEALSD